jgi:beta-lactamase regulating signal transducer with metallopeptidase domain
MKNAVISARIPMPVKLELDRLLSLSGMSTSEFIQSTVSKSIANRAISGGAVASAVSSANIVAQRSNIVPTMTVDNEIADMMIALGGGSALGLSVYFIVKYIVEEYYPERTDAKDIAAISGMAVGVGSAMAIFASKK